MKDYIKTEVDKLVQRYKTRDVYELIDKLNIILLKVPLHPSVNGLYQYFKRNKIIYLNNGLDSIMERHVLAHELGHAILHPKINITYLESNTFYSKEKIEIAANTFAAELLIEDSLFDEYKNHTIEEMAAIENLPIELIKIKLKYIKFM